MSTENLINYKDIKALGFTETKDDDSVYFDTYGYEYVIFDLLLVEICQHNGDLHQISLEWDQPSRVCRLMRTNADGAVLGKMDVSGRDNLFEIYNFYKIDRK